MRTDTTGDSLVALYADFVTLWQKAPMPAARRKPGDRTENADAVAVALAWGWMVRVSRTGEAAMRLDQAGFSHEAAPLVRSMLEHAIRLRWAAAAGSDFVEAALRMRAASLRTIMRNQISFEYNPEVIAKMEVLIAEQDEAFSGRNNLHKLKDVVDTDPEGLGVMYQTWLLDSQVSHPTVMSAASYFTRHEGGFDLRGQPMEQDSVGLPACQSILGAVASYSTISGLEEYFNPRLEPLLVRLAPFMLDLT